MPHGSAFDQVNVQGSCFLKQMKLFHGLEGVQCRLSTARIPWESTQFYVDMLWRLTFGNSDFRQANDPLLQQMLGFTAKFWKAAPLRGASILKHLVNVPKLRSLFGMLDTEFCPRACGQLAVFLS